MAEKDKKFVLGFVKDKSLHLIKSIQGERGNGIDTVTVNESPEDSGYNNITITFTDGVSKSFQVKNGTGITSIVQTVVAEGDDQFNRITVNLSNGDSFEFIVRNGSKGDPGIQGTSAIWNANAEVLTELEHEPGTATNRTMSQNAITEFVNGRFVKVDSEDAMEAMIDAGPNTENGYDPDIFYYTEEE